MATVIPESLFSDPYSHLLDKYELAKCLNVSVRSIDYMIANRRIPVIRLGNRPRFRLRDVEKALERYTIKEVSL